ncbi:probable 28S ribosomal protein S23, mitochondrial [Chrysoperla carnea]|uniref:probable 28S ribosomal protein S23, mitochondrial n=1 Tax=Chrysoperla carnea TaxID=189513 RepID=UPI001D07C049|nr:probable 28S ribosomal protein S23, mitochondrial [Chrysoperla carnea]
MARSRLEKIGTIFERVGGLLKSGAIKAEDKPIWFDVYDAFPPKLEPRYDRPAPKISVKPIFYKEDIVRAKFQRNYKTLGTINLRSSTPTVTQQFLSTYDRLSKENSNQTENELYESALNVFNNERATKRQQLFENQNESSSKIQTGNTSQENNKLSNESKNSIKDIFKE